MSINHAKKKSTIQTMIKLNHENYWLIISNHIILDVNIYLAFVKEKKNLNKSLQYRRFNPLGMKQNLSLSSQNNNRRYYHTVFPIKEQRMLLHRYKERNIGKLLFVTLLQ